MDHSRDVAVSRTESPPETDTQPVPPGVTVDHTAELRWFFDGRLPDDVSSWFRGDDSAGLTETRRDSYRLDGQVDIGVKRRYGTILELKLRQGPPQSLLHRGLEGQLEVWRRWSPADEMIYLNDDTTWVDIDKTVVKRRFALDGEETPLTEANRAMTGEGCDAEVAMISVRDQPAWTFALAAFGPADRHHSLLLTAWEALVRERFLPRRLPLACANSCGYPEWMARHHDTD